MNSRELTRGREDVHFIVVPGSVVSIVTTLITDYYTFIVRHIEMSCDCLLHQKIPILEQTIVSSVVIFSDKNS